MGRYKTRPLQRGPYPTDCNGIPLYPCEVNPAFIEPKPQELWKPNNHHMAYFAKTFGRFAISQTFRDLQSLQVPLPRWRHELIHDMYTGIRLPGFIEMMERIDEEKELGGQLQVFNKSTHQYELHPITDERWDALAEEYNRLDVGPVLVDLGA